MTAPVIPFEAFSLPARAIEACLQGLAPNSQRAYRQRINAWLDWSSGPLDREQVKRYMAHLEANGATAQVRNQTLAAIKRLANEAAEMGWLSHAANAQIGAIKSAKQLGIRGGQWLTKQQVVDLLASIDRSTLIGKRDAALIALLIGCGLRRAEATGLHVEQIVFRDGHVILENVRGKGNRVRTVRVPAWAWRFVREWMEAIR